MGRAAGSAMRGQLGKLEGRKERGKVRLKGETRGEGTEEPTPHPRCPLITRYSFHGACHSGLGHLLGRRFATWAGEEGGGAGGSRWVTPASR